MRIFFDASLSGKREYGDAYRRIITVLRELGHEVITPLERGRTSTDVARETTEEAQKYYKRLRSWILHSNLCIFEVSFPSTGIGHEITFALYAGKPVIALHLKERDPYVLEAMAQDKLQVLEYFTTTLKKTLTDAISVSSEQMDTRFNFFITRRLNSYLDWISRKRRIPRAVYIRQLIRKEMRGNKEYQRMLV